MKKLFFLFSLTVFPLISQAQISQKNVTKIIKTLSSDSMRGRQAFSPEIWDAANFIADEFSTVGLKPLKGDDDYLQEFTMQAFSLKDAKVQVAGESIMDENYFAITNNEDVHWTDPDDVSVKYIDPGEDFRTKLSSYNDLEKDLVVFVDASHADMFNRFKPYFSRPSYVFADDKHYNKLFILAPKTDHFNIQLTKKVQEQKLANVAGMIEGKRKDEKVLFSAHYDHIGIQQPVEGDSIANGANDDASGTAAVIELAGHFAQQGQPERTLVFVAFTAEEMGGYGSQYFSKQLNPDHIVAMFNIEMIGKPATDGPNSAWVTGFDRSSFGKLLQKSAEGTKYKFYPDPYSQQNLFYRSDNATLARLGVPAHSISTTPIDVDEDYHQVSDEIETLNLSHLTNTIEAIAKAADGIVSGKDTPTRVDTATVE